MNDSIKADITLSIISFNIKYDNRSDKINNWDIRKDEIINLILSESPSFIGIQEGLLNQIQYLKGSLPNYENIGNLQAEEINIIEIKDIIMFVETNLKRGIDSYNNG